MNNTPEIRFPEFKRDGEWKLDTIRNIADYENGKAHERDIHEKGKYIVVNSKFISTNGAIKKHTNTAFCLARKGDILMVLSDVPNGKAIAKCFIVNEDDKYTVNQRVCIIRAKEINSSLLYYLLNRNSYFLSFDDGVKQTNLKNDDVLNCALLIPKLLIEQQKIADCLSSLGDIITSYEQKLKAIQKHKNGLMQNLFPQKGKTKPNYRFPEFENDEDWVEKNFDSIATFLKGKGISKADIVDGGKTPCIRYGELYTKYKETIEKVVSYTNLPVKDLLFSKANDVIIPASGETQLDIATASCVLNDDIALGGDLNIIRSTNNGVFLSYYLNNAKKYEIARMAQGNAVVHLYPHQLKTLNLQLPQLKEQEKIANCLSAVDELIGQLLNKIEQLRLHKKGLMQGLFPEIQEYR